VRLASITINKYRNFSNEQSITIEPDVTNLVGKNESGKTTILKALHRLKPANGSDHKFDLTTEYPRWRLARDRRSELEILDTQPIRAVFSPTDANLDRLEELIGLRPPSGTTLNAARTYDNDYIIWLDCPDADLIAAVADACKVSGEDQRLLLQRTGLDEASRFAKQRAQELKEEEPLRSEALTAFPDKLAEYRDALVLTDDDVWKEVEGLVPEFFYFSSYNVLPGDCDLTDLARKIEAKESLTDPERSVVALLAHAGVKPSDFMDTDYNSRKAELQAASVDLSQNVFKYWRQNTDLEVVFDTDNVVQKTEPSGNQVTHRILKIELRDARHGNVETNFSTRSTGFQWFFSFFAAFSEYQDSKQDIVVLLDEPGTSLHGDAQRDFVRFVFEELGASKQTIYTTHSQHMIDPAKYEKLRAVHDKATRDNPDLGVEVSLVNLSADKATLLPIESAIGYSISQHLFLGGGQHLAVEGSSDFVYLQRFTEHLLRQGKEGLDPRLAIIPVGGADNLPAFVALLGRRLRVSALVDGPCSSPRVTRIKAAAKNNGVPESNVVAVSQVSGMPNQADVEDLFVSTDYLKLYNWAFGKSLEESDLASTGEPLLKRIEDVEGEFNHALPAHALTDHRTEFFDGVDSQTVKNFEELFELLNATVSEES